MLPTSDLLLLNKRGLVPGPQESDQDFWRRAESAKTTYDEWRETHPLTSPLFDFSLDWVEIFYSKKRLPFWQGALTWLEKIPRIQLHPQFKKGSLLKIYSRQEVLAHEAVHAARAQFFEPRFEEHFAYLTGRKGFRRILGPLLRSDREGRLFLALLALSTAGAMFGVAWLSLLPCAALSFGVMRLARAHSTFRRCEQNLVPFVREKQMVLALMLRLADKEIATIAKSSSEEVARFISQHKNSSLRWKMLSAAYLKEVMNDE